MNYQQMIQTDGKYDARKDIWSTVSLHGDEYYTLPQHVNDIIDNLTLPKGSLIWCPFDKEESQFNILLQQAGYYVRRGHIAEGKDFFECPPPLLCDGIISNPPFSRKKEVLARIKELDLPFALILPLIWMNDGVPFDYGSQFIFWRKRVHFTTADGEKNHPRSTCFAFSNGLFKQDLKIIY